MAKEKSIPKRNYWLALGITLLTIGLVAYIFRWYFIYQEENLNKAIISDYLTEISYEEFEDYIKESDHFAVYIGISSQLESRDFENNFKNVVSNYNLRDDVIFLNLTEFSEENADYISKLNKKYQTDENHFNAIPALVIFENGKIHDIEDVNLNKRTAIDILEKHEIIEN